MTQNLSEAVPDRNVGRRRRVLPRASLLVVAAGISLAAYAASDFDHPASSDTAQQFSATNVQRQDTPDDPDYDCAEADTTSASPCSNLFDERFDLFGFPSQLTRSTAVYADPSDTTRFGNPQVSGYNAAGAWKIERGRPDVAVAILDTGIKWDKCDLRRQIRLNAAELPLPQRADGSTDPTAGLGGYDLDGNGAVDVDDYKDDPRVGREFTSCGGQITAKDLINQFSDGSDADGNGYVDDIAGWNFFDDNNDPTDRSSYFAAKNHGSGRTEEAVNEGNNGSGDLGVCPHCQFVPLRVWDTFVSDANTFGLAVTYAADNGVQVIEGADGALYHSAFMEAAVEYAHAKGSVMTFSGDDLNTGNHNYPGNYNHVMLIQGTVPDNVGLGTGNNNFQQGRDFFCAFPPLNTMCPGSNLPVGTYFRGANTTQFGGHSSISMEGPTGSTNTGKASGAAALVVSAGLDFSPSIPLSPDEVREILEQTAEDVTPLNTNGSGTAEATQAGWDSHFGYGRVNLGAAVQAVKDGNIPPEASIVTPDWYAPLVGDSVAITGVARARRSASGNFHYKLEWGPGLAPTSWNTVAENDASGTATDLGTLNLKAVRAAMAAYTVPTDPGDATFAPNARHPLQDQFTVRLTVTDPDHPDHLPGIDRKVLTAIPDGQNLVAGYPKRMGSGGEAPLRYADLNGDNVQELIVPTEDGKIHAYEPDGSELPGWPVSTLAFPRAVNHQTAPVFASGGVSLPGEPPRGPTIADLDGDGHRQVVTAAGIHVYVFNEDGSTRAGFPVESNPAFCAPDQQQQDNLHPKCGFLATPALARLDGPDQPPSIIAPGLDGRLYAWHGDGTPVSWSPLLLSDANVAAADRQVAESINNPAIGDLNGDGIDDIVVGTNEVYSTGGGTVVVPGAPSDVSFANVGTTSTRVYAVDGASGQFLSGWPVAVSGIIQDVLPFIGPGQDAALAKINGTQQIVLSATGTGVPGVGSGLATYGVNGMQSVLMKQDGKGPLSNITDPSGGINLFESAVVGNLLGVPGGPLSVVKYQLGVADAGNLLLVGQNFPYNHMIGAWDATTGTTLPAFPTITDDFQFLSSSTIAKIDSSVPENQVLAGTGLGLLHAYDGVTGADVSGFPKVTGGWLFAPAAIGESNRIAAMTREGFLFEWTVGQPACQSEWPSFRHDEQGSGNYDRDGTPPGAVTQLGASRAADGSVNLQWVASGNNGTCDATAADHYRVSVDHVARSGVALTPAAAGTVQDLSLDGIDAAAHDIVVQAVDAAGNVGYPVSVALDAVGGGGAAAGTVTASAPLLVNGGPGEAVGNAGAFRLSNTGTDAQTVSSITLQLDHPEAFQSMTLHGPGGRTATVEIPTGTSVFTFSPALSLAAGAHADFQLSAELSAQPEGGHTAMLDSHWNWVSTAYAGDGAMSGGVTLPFVPWAAVLLLSGLAMGRSRRKVFLAMLAATLFVAGCGISHGPSGGTPASLAYASISSTVDVAAVSAQAGTQTVSYSGLPARLSTVTRTP